jgi:hypothetical protein
MSYKHNHRSALPERPARLRFRLSDAQVYAQASLARIDGTGVPFICWRQPLFVRVPVTSFPAPVTSQVNRGAHPREKFRWLCIQCYRTISHSISHGDRRG